MSKEAINPCSAFVCKYDGPAKQLKSKITITSEDGSFEVEGQWDTGATGTCISRDVVKELKLVPTGMSRIQTPSGISDVNTYLVDILLPNNLQLTDIEVMDSEIGDQGIGILIGMDIIIRGDFAVSCHQGKTSFTFRTPSQKCADFTKDIRAQNVYGKKHGQGKRKRSKGRKR